MNRKRPTSTLTSRHESREGSDVYNAEETRRLASTRTEVTRDAAEHRRGETKSAKYECKGGMIMRNDDELCL